MKWRTYGYSEIQTPTRHAFIGGVVQVENFPSLTSETLVSHPNTLVHSSPKINRPLISDISQISLYAQSYNIDSKMKDHTSM